MGYYITFQHYGIVSLNLCISEVYTSRPYRATSTTNITSFFALVGTLTRIPHDVCSALTPVPDYGWHGGGKTYVVPL